MSQWSVTILLEKERSDPEFGRALSGFASKVDYAGNELRISSCDFMDRFSSEKTQAIAQNHTKTVTAIRQ